MTIQLLVAIALGTSLVATVDTGVAQTSGGEDHLTGCLTKGGAIIKLAQGDEPSRPCGRSQSKITLKIEDPSAPDEPDTSEIIPFLLSLDGDGAEETIAINGSLEVFVRCELNKQDPSNPSRFLDVVSVIATSNEDHWASSTTANLSAGEEVALFSSGNDFIAGLEGYGALTPANNRGSAVAADGSYIGVAADTTGLGVNILGSDCIAVGTAILIKSNLE